MFETSQATPRAAASPLPGASSGTAQLAHPTRVAPQDVHLLDRLGVVVRHRRLITTIFVLTVAVMMAQSYSTIPLYRAKAQLLIQDERSTAVSSLKENDPAYWADPEPYYNTQYRILQGRGLARRVVRKLHLHNVPEFNGTLPGPPGPLQAMAAVRARVKTAALSIVALVQPPPAVEALSADETAAEAGFVGAFLTRVQVDPVRGTRLVDLYFSSADPQFAARAVDTLADEYVEQNLELRLQNIDKTLVWLGQELDKQQKKVTDSEQALADYRSSQNALSLDNRQNIVVARLNALNEAVTRARTVRAQKESLYVQVRSVDPNSDASLSLPAIVTNTAVVEIRNRLTSLEADRARLSGRYGPQHPEMLKIDTGIENARQQLKAETAKVIEQVKSDYEAALAEERSLSRSLEEQKTTAMDLDRKSANYTVLEREAETNRQVYQQLLQQEKELRVISNSRANNVQVMDRADVPGAPFTPNTRRDWMTAILLGALLSLGIAFGVEYIDDTVKTPEDVTRRLNLPLLGIVPAVRGDKVPVLTGNVPHDFGEAFRALRTSLVFTSGGSEGARVVGVTSTQPLEGKTTTACNLAAALALGGARVLLIDADMRRPGLHKAMGMQNAVGLSHLLVGQTRVRDAVQRTNEPNLFVITAGRTPPNPSELLASDRMKAFVKNLATGPFDWVIIDTPPVLAVTDSVILSQFVAGLVFVVGAEMTRRVHVERALETLAPGRPHVIGVVLNRVDFDANKYYYSRYYGYQYKSYYGQPAAS
jgi:succinoglycan biosynthesis transport protein ExoP